MSGAPRIRRGRLLGLVAAALLASSCDNLGVDGAGSGGLPGAPVALVAIPSSPTMIRLSWAAGAGAENIGRYRLFRDGAAVGDVNGTSYPDGELTPSTTYVYTVAALGAEDQISATSQPAVATTLAAGQSDGVPPTAPTSLTAVPASSSAISLSWAASSDAVGVLAYHIFRDGGEIGTSTTTTYSDQGLSASTTYAYHVVARDAANNASPPSNTANATTLATGQSDTQAPTAPTSLSATAVSSTSIALTWTASTDNAGVLGYRIYRNGSEVGTATGASFTDAGLTPSTFYLYSVTARDAAGNTSSPSAPAGATTPSGPQSDTQAPTAPPSLSASATSSTTATLSWAASSDNVGVTGYRVFRNGAEVGTTGSTGYNDTGLSPSTSYSYTVTAYDAAGNTSGASHRPSLPLRRRRTPRHLRHRRHSRPHRRVRQRCRSPGTPRPTT